MPLHLLLSTALSASTAIAPSAFPGEIDNGPSLTATLTKALFPVAAYLFLAPILWFFFRRTWRELDVSAHEQQGKLLASGGYNYRPAALFVITALVLTLQEYYGGRDFYADTVKPWRRNELLPEDLQIPVETYGGDGGGA